MTTQTINLKFVLSQGNTLPGLRQIAAETNSTAQKISRAQHQANLETTRSYGRMHHEVVAEIRKTAQAREQLGIRSEQAVRAEIWRTQQAYATLARSGEASARELARAHQAMTRQVRELNRELRTSHDLQSKLGTAATAGAAVMAGGYVVGRQVNQAMSFDERLALMANTAFADAGVSARMAGMRKMEAVIKRSVSSGIGGGTREQAAEALDAMIARNVLGRERSMQFLPTVMRTATGSGAQPLDIANLSSVLVGQRIVNTDKELKTALNMITAAGQSGGFEIKDMAKWLSQQLPLAQKSGLMGLNGLQKVLTMNQAAILTAGSTDEAGNNVRNLLTKLNSSDTAKDFEKQGRGDLSKFLMQQRVKGVDAVDAWMNLLDKESEKNPQMKAMLAKLKTTKDKGQQKELIDSLNAISEGTVIGKYFQDMQATGALLGMRNKPIVDQVNSAIGSNRTATGVNDTNYAMMQNMSSVKTRAALEAKDAAVKSAMDGLTPIVGKVATQFETLSQKHPLLTGATVTATAAISAMAGAASIAAFALNRAGGKDAISIAGRVALGTGAGAAAAGFFSNLAALPGLGIGSLLHGMPVLAAMNGINQTLFNPAAMGEMVPPKQAPAQVETTVRVELADGLKATHQTSDKKGPVKAWLETGSVWGHP